MFKRSSLVNVIREGLQETEQMKKINKSTREQGNEAAIRGPILQDWDLELQLIDASQTWRKNPLC